MVQEYIQYKQKDEFQTLKPNTKLIFLKNSLTVIGAVLAIIIILFILNWQVGLDVLLIPFETLGITINPSAILLYAISAVVVIFFFLLIGNYLITRNIRYEFHKDKLVLYENSFLVSVKPKEISYQNIVKVTYNSDGFFNSIFNSGTIVLDLSGMEKDKIKLEFINNIENITKWIQGVIGEFKKIQQAQFTENYKIDTVFNKYEY